MFQHIAAPSGARVTFRGGVLRAQFSDFEIAASYADDIDKFQVWTRLTPPKGSTGRGLGGSYRHDLLDALSAALGVALELTNDKNLTNTLRWYWLAGVEGGPDQLRAELVAAHEALAKAGTKEER